MSHRALLLAWTLLALVATPAPLYAQAPDAPRLAAAKELMQVAGVAKQFDEVMPLLAQQLSESFVAVAPDKADLIREVFAQMAIKFVDRKGELIDQIAVLYAEKLTLEDLTAVIGFYKSPGRPQVHCRAARDGAPIDGAGAALGRPDRPRDRGGGPPRAEEARHRPVSGNARPAGNCLWVGAQSN